MNNSKDYSIFAGERFIESMRSSGYKDTSYALAELVDNSIDAGAKHMMIICHEKYDSVRNRYILDRIGVLDDGHGMNATDLRTSLLFGDGTKISSSHKIGKYGMGLPNASLSQCKRVSVYSWQESTGPLYTYLDVDKVKEGQRTIPVPQKKKIPAIWIKSSTQKKLNKNGTLIVWDKLDRCSWVSSKKIKEHSEFLIGRIYRRFLDKSFKKPVIIKIITCKINDNDDIVGEPDVALMRPNDPMYLMAPSSTPGIWGKKSMFKMDTNGEEKYEIQHDGKKHEITVRYSIEKNDLRSLDKGDQGNTKHGKHAGKNTGVSIMRANREIVLDTSLGTTSDPRDRWCGTEIDIPTSLDSVVGLTNNKQQVDRLQSIMRTVGRFGDDGSDRDDIIDQYKDSDPAQLQLLYMVREIRARIISMQRRIRLRRQATRGKNRSSDIDEKISGAIKDDQKEGRTTEGDEERKSPEGQRIAQTAQQLILDGQDKDEAYKTATEWIKDGKHVVFEEAELEGHSFFSVEYMSGILRIKINSTHAAYRNLLLLVNRDRCEGLTDQERIKRAEEGLQLLLASWARYENLIENNQKKKSIQDVRYAWGRELDVFLNQNQ